jgi:hypothetical protein
LYFFFLCSFDLILLFLSFFPITHPSSHTLLSLFLSLTHSLILILRANKWKVDGAFGQLSETLAWRRDFRLNELTPKSIEKQLRVGKMYTNGRDKAGRPVIYTKKRVENTEAIDFEMQVSLKQKLE